VRDLWKGWRGDGTLARVWKVDKNRNKYFTEDEKKVNEWCRNNEEREVDIKIVSGREQESSNSSKKRN
jgi:hypothetical protein